MVLMGSSDGFDEVDAPQRPRCATVEVLIAPLTGGVHGRS